MTVYQRTVPSAVLGEYLADLYRFEAAATSTLKRDYFLAPCQEKGEGLAPTLAEWFGEEIAYEYWDVLAQRAKHAVTLRRRPPYPFRKIKATAPKVEEPKPKPKRKPWQNARRGNERRMREAILRRAKPNGWTGIGVRELAREANLPHKTADDTLARMVAEGQVERDRREGKRGNRHGFRIIREHPCWSTGNSAHSLERLDASPQLEG